MNQTDYFTEKIATLPEDLQDAIRASNHETTLKEIQREYKLHIDQAQTLETLALQLIFGDIDAPQFVTNMFNDAHVSSAVAGDILLKIDMLILKKIREYMEEVEEVQEKQAALDKLLMSEEEEIEEDKANAYAAYYADVANINKEVEQELLAKGYLPDGSNITDEILAKELGITLEELHKKMQVGAIQEANNNTDLNVQDEKEELLHELESPEKSFIKPLFKPVARPASTPITVAPNTEKITLPDHQLQNTHVEKPFVEEVVVPQKQEAPTPTPVTPSAPTMKKPTKITLSTDPYKEPLE